MIQRSLLFALLSLTACDLLTAPSVATTIRLSPAELTFDALGENLRVTATVEDQSGNVMSNDTVTWTASDQGIATVSFSGLVTAVGPGTSTVTATASSASGTATVTVIQTPTSLELSDTVISFYSLGDTTRIRATVRDENQNLINDSPVVWTTSDSSVAGISSGGLIRAYAVGSVTITATLESLQAEARITITVWESITAGQIHSCGLMVTGTAYCWGSNRWGQLGDGTGSDRSVPTTVGGRHSWRSISAGESHTC
ncbi:MAG: Ig-like domain-containing protein, partial [Acidobacteria bacterium]|nr:Ig-like domain-containing protein [Acidobacteriota bacterium]